MKKTYKITNLDCANCALKIQNQISAIDGVTHAKVDLAKERIFIEGQLEEIDILQLNRIAKSIESQVSVLDIDQDDMAHQHSIIELILNIIGTIILISSFLIDYLIFGFTRPQLILILFVLSYLLI